METPEKVYLQPSTIEQLPHQNIVYTKPLADNSIEYTRTDAQQNALEVKEVDLENELKEDWLFADKTEVDCLECMCLTEDMFISLVKKYFTLGLQVQKGE